MRSAIQLVLIQLLALVSIVACSAEEPTATPRPTPTAAEYLSLASDAMLDIESVQFSLTRNGSPVIIDANLGATLVSAAGEYQAPDRVHAEVKADLAGNVIAIDLLWLPEGNFMSNPLTGAYMDQPAELAVNPAALFDRSAGISQVLAESVMNPASAGVETIEGVEARRITGLVEAQEIEFLNPVGLTGELEIDLWLDTESSRVIRIQITEPAGDLTTLDLFGFDEPVEIPTPG